MTLTGMQFKVGEWGRGVAAGAALIALAAVDRGLSALWPASYGLFHPLVAIAAANLPLLAVYLIMRS
ncbi:hypothetical protein FPJ27_36735 (plasmid) [Burkholderia sp. MS455]|uniref:hypothetical protein n=1 Tax=Burkholderia sp. MS455 TaxID=2811788 RepID=UPI00195B08A4|nr:hypothetical protein [Burkholderia sp. MS455]QRR11762.1 hypothetical protein FPJ27_36735 [Burkholderia sp. MS455]